jgi:branched-chain amino acid transport system permease protein
VDLRGCGSSEQAGYANTITQYSADVHALVQKLGLRQGIVVGHSMGGSIAMDLAVSCPEFVKGMVLVNPAPAEGFFTPEERQPLLEKMIQDRNLMRMALTAVVPTAAHGDLFEALVDDAMIAGPTVVSNYKSLCEADYRQELAEIKIPALIVYGKQDSLISLDMMERTRDVIAGSELLVYDEVGHSPNVEAPVRLTADIHKFLNSLAC